MIRWTFGQDTQCDKPEHLAVRGDPQHSSLLPNGVTTLTWQAGDRREYTGDYPGPCPLLWAVGQSCTLHAGHHGRCAP